METGRSSGPRKSVNLLVKLAEEGVDDFVEEKFATNISSGGMFIWSRTPRPIGTCFEVRVEIAGGARLVQGTMMVRWIRMPDSPYGPPGMGLEFITVDQASVALIDRMLGPPEVEDSPEPEPAEDFTSQLASELSEELADPNADVPADFTDEFAEVAEPPVDFTDDFAPVADPVPELKTDSMGVSVLSAVLGRSPNDVPATTPGTTVSSELAAKLRAQRTATSSVPYTPEIKTDKQKVPSLDVSSPEFKTEARKIPAPPKADLELTDARQLPPLPRVPAPPPSSPDLKTEARKIPSSHTAAPKVPPPRPSDLDLKTEARKIPAPLPSSPTAAPKIPPPPPSDLDLKTDARRIPSPPPSSPDFKTEAKKIPAPFPSSPKPPPPPASDLDLKTDAPKIPAPSPSSPEFVTEARKLPVPPPSPDFKTEARKIPAPPPSSPAFATETRKLPDPPPSSSELKTEARKIPSDLDLKTEARKIPDLPPAPEFGVWAPKAPAEAKPKKPASTEASWLEAKADKGIPAPDPTPPDPTGEFKIPDVSGPAFGFGTSIEINSDLSETPAADRTSRVQLPIEPPPEELSEQPADDRTGQWTLPIELSAPSVEVSTSLMELPAPAPAAAQRTLASNPAPIEAAAQIAPPEPNPFAIEVVTLTRPPAKPKPAPKPAAKPVAKPAPKAAAAEPTLTTRPKPRTPPAVTKPTKDAVDIDLKVLVNTTPAPPPDEKTNVFIDPTLFASTAVGPPTSPPTRRTTREMLVEVPRGVLKQIPIRRSRKVDELAYLGPSPEFFPDSPLVGIDLGTTNSCCAVLSGGKPVVLKTKTGQTVIPSLIAINRLSKLVVGYTAHAEMLQNPAQCIYGSKRLVGRDFESPAVAAVRERFHYEIVAGRDAKAAVMLGGKVVSLEEVQAIVLNECRLMAEAFLSKRVSRAVVTCPAYFTEQQRQSIRVAGALAGLRIERILIEPTAAALAYGLNQDLSRKVLVYDVGGGTFDATLLRIEKNVFEVLATGGDVFLGGLDFDSQLIDQLLKKFQSQHNVAFEADPGALARVADQAEKAKIALSERETIEVQLPMLQLGPKGKPLGLSCTLTRAELEQSCAPLVERTIEVLGELLRDGGLKASEVDEVVLVGGMSRMPMVRERLKTMFGKPPHASVNAEEAVAVGAALFSGVIDKVSNVVLIDVAPMTLGFGLPGGGYKRVINRNTPLPASASIGVATTEEMSDVIEISVFQGEDADVSVNDYLGTIRVDGLPRAPKGLVKVAINLKLDADCVLHVEAREMHTRRLFASTLATRYTNAEVRTRLGIKPQAAKAAVARRAEELKSRGGKFWSFLRSVIKRRS